MLIWPHLLINYYVSRKSTKFLPEKKPWDAFPCKHAQKKKQWLVQQCLSSYRNKRQQPFLFFFSSIHPYLAIRVHQKGIRPLPRQASGSLTSLNDSHQLAPSCLSTCYAGRLCDSCSISDSCRSVVLLTCEDVCRWKGALAVLLKKWTVKVQYIVVLVFFHS